MPSGVSKRCGGASGRVAEALTTVGPSQERSASKKSSRARASPTAAAAGELASMLSTSPEAPTVTCSVPSSATRRRWRRPSSPGARRPTSSCTPRKDRERSRFTAQPPAEGSEDGLVGVVAAGAVHALQHRWPDSSSAQLLHRPDGEGMQQQAREDRGGGAGQGVLAAGDRDGGQSALSRLLGELGRDRAGERK